MVTDNGNLALITPHHYCILIITVSKLLLQY